MNKHRALPVDLGHRDGILSLARKPGWVILTASNPNNCVATDEQNEQANAKLAAFLVSNGYQFERLLGRYGADKKEEVSYMVFYEDNDRLDLLVATAVLICSQESIIVDGDMVFLDGSTPKWEMKYITTFLRGLPDNNYTKAPNGVAFRIEY